MGKEYRKKWERNKEEVEKEYRKKWERNTGKLGKEIEATKFITQEQASVSILSGHSTAVMMKKMQSFY